MLANDHLKKRTCNSSNRPIYASDKLLIFTKLEPKTLALIIMYAENRFDCL